MKKRQLNFELLRIISMMLIIAHHYVLYSNVFNNVDILSSSSFFSKVLLAGGKFGVILFVMITGYFNCDKDYNVKKVFNIILHTFFYSLVFLLIAIIMNYKIDLKILLKSLLPITFNHYWFSTSYIMLFLFMPFINKLINNLSKREYSYFLIVISLFVNIIPSLTFAFFPINNLGYLIYIYVIGAYIKLHCNNKCEHKYKYLIISLALYFISCLLTIALQYFSISIDFFNDKINHYLSLNSIFLYISAICLFLFFKNIKINAKFNKFITFFSTTSFGVYLIHENYFVREFLWKNIARIFNANNFILIIGYSILCIFVVYIICSVIDYIYQKVIEKSALKFLYHLYDIIKEKIVNKFAKCYKESNE